MSMQTLQDFMQRKIFPEPIIPRPLGSYKELKTVIEPTITSKREKGITAGISAFVQGEASAGKSLTLAMIAKERENDGVPILSNMVLKVKNYRFFDDVEILRTQKNAILIIDEFRRYADSYQTQSQQSRLISNLLADLKKNSIDFYFSDQHLTAPPTRVRTNINVWIYPQFDVNTNWCYIYLFDSEEKRYFYEPFWYFAFYAPEYWDLFDTRRKIEDYKIKYNPMHHAYRFVAWCSVENMPIDGKSIDYWSITRGEEISRVEKDAVLFYIERNMKSRYKKLFRRLG